MDPSFNLAIWETSVEQVDILSCKPVATRRT